MGLGRKFQEPYSQLAVFSISFKTGEVRSVRMRQIKDQPKWSIFLKSIVRCSKCGGQDLKVKMFRTLLPTTTHPCLEDDGQRLSFGLVLEKVKQKLTNYYPEGNRVLNDLECFSLY